MARHTAATTEDPSDADLAARYTAGIEREASVAELFARHGASTFAFFLRRTGDHELARDLNQSLYLSVVRGLAGFRGEASFRTWLFCLARNELSRLRRRWQTHLDEQPDEVPDEFWRDLAAADQESAEGLVYRRQVRALIVACLAHLTEIERAVVVGHYYRGATLRQLTERLELTNRSGARGFLLAAQRRLRRCLERSLAADADPGSRR